MSHRVYRKLVWKIKNFKKNVVHEKIKEKPEEALSTNLFDVSLEGHDFRWNLSLYLDVHNDDDDDDDQQDVKLDDEIGTKNYGIYLHLSDISNLSDLENYHAQFFIFFRGSDGQLEEQFFCGNPLSKFKFHGYGKRLSYEDLFDENEKLIGNDDTLEIIAYLTLYRKEPEEANDESPFARFFNSAHYSDFEIKCSDGSIPAHQNILEINAPTLLSVLQDRSGKTKCTQAVMTEILRFIYTKKIDNIDEVATDLYIAAKKFELVDIQRKCIEALSENIDLENVFFTLAFADNFNEEVLMHNCLEYVIMRFEELEDSQEWDKIDKKLILKITASAIKNPVKIMFQEDTL